MVQYGIKKSKYDIYIYLVIHDCKLFPFSERFIFIRFI